jgi:hypothetical protein
MWFKLLFLYFIDKLLFSIILSFVYRGEFCIHIRYNITYIYIILVFNFIYE